MSTSVFGSRAPFSRSDRTARCILGLAIFATLFGLTMRRGATDPVCGMKVDRKKAYMSEVEGRTVFFCSGGCQEQFESESESYVGRVKAPHGTARTV